LQTEAGKFQLEGLHKKAQISIYFQRNAKVLKSFWRSVWKVIILRGEEVEAGDSGGDCFLNHLQQNLF